jgi:hypothetical protein
MVKGPLIKNKVLEGSAKFVIFNCELIVVVVLYYLVVVVSLRII